MPAPTVSIPPTWRGVALVDAEVDCTPESPAVVGFELREILGEGGMGTVYRGLQEYPQRVVALKVLKSRAANSDAFRRFKREVDVLARLQHPGIPHLFSAGTLESPGGKIPYIAMELVQGQAIDAYCDARQLGPKERIDVFLRVCDAVSAVHRSGILHRDLSPHNILVNDLGQPKVLDFGLACFTQENAHLQTMVTIQGRPFGTIGYMSPEQASGRTQDVDARSDVYSLGVVLYKLLTGALAVDVEGLELFDAIERIHTVEPIPLGKRNRTFRGDLEIIVAKALSKQNRLRYQNVLEFAEDIRRCQSHLPISARPPSFTYRAAKFLKRHATAVAVTATIGCLIVAGFLTTWLETAKARVARHDLALQQAFGSVAQGNASLANRDFETAKISYDLSWDLFAQEQGDSLPARLGLWEVARHVAPMMRIVDPESAYVERVSIASNDSLLAILKTGGRIVIRDVATNQPVAEFETKQNVRDMQFSPDGRRLLILGEGNCELWNSRTGSCERVLPHPQTFSLLMTVSNTCIDMAVGNQLTRTPFDVQSQPTKWAIPGADVCAIGTTSQGELLTVDADWKLRSCRTNGGSVEIGEVPHSFGDSHLLFSPSGSALVVIGKQEATVYAVPGLHKISSITGIASGAGEGFAGDSSLCLMRDSRGPKLLFDISGEPRLQLPQSSTSCVAFTRNLAIVGEDDKVVKLFLTSPNIGSRLLSGEQSAASAALDPSGHLAAYGTNDDHVDFCDTKTGGVLHDVDCSIPLQGEPIRRMSFGARGMDLVIASTQRVVFLDSSSGKIEAVFVPPSPISGLAFASAAETAIAASRSSKTFFLWRRWGDQWTMMGVPIDHLEREVDITADGNEVLLGGSDSGVELWKTGTNIGIDRSFPKLVCPRAFFDAGGSRIISTGDFNEIQVTPRDGSAPSALLAKSDAAITGITPFGQNGVVFYSGGRLAFFDLRDHHQVYSLPTPNFSGQFLSASSDGDRLLAWSHNPGPAILLDFGIVRDLRRIRQSVSDEVAGFSSATFPGKWISEVSPGNDVRK